MERFKKSVDDAMPFLLLGSVLLMNILLITGMMKMFFGWDTTILAGVIAFIGALIGGSITLIGVQLTVEHNVKMKSREELPSKLNNIEEVVYELERITEKDLSFYDRSSYEINNNFIEVNKYIECERKGNFEKYVVEVPNELKTKITFIDAEAYRMFLEFKDKLFKLESTFADEEISLMDFREKINFEVVRTYSGEEIEIRHRELDSSDQEELSELKRLIQKRDRELTYRIQQIYTDLYLQLIIKHEQLIKGLNY